MGEGFGKVGEGFVTISPIPVYKCTVLSTCNSK